LDEEETVELLLLRQEFVAKEERLSAIQEERERERRQLTERITELREQLAQSELERREKDRQLTALLTDQRSRDVEKAAAPTTTGRWFAWLRRGLR
jgi:hypothetical protein